MHFEPIGMGLSRTTRKFGRRSAPPFESSAALKKYFAQDSRRAVARRLAGPFHKRSRCVARHRKHAFIALESRTSFLHLASRAAMKLASSSLFFAALVLLAARIGATAEGIANRPSPPSNFELHFFAWNRAPL